jgi:iron(II)-dependent oxidoreductase
MDHREPRPATTLTAEQMDVATAPGMRYFDLYHGTELKPEANPDSSSPFAVLSFSLEAHGYGAILATHGEPSEAIKALMQRMAAMTGKPLASYSHAPEILPQSIVEIPA